MLSEYHLKWANMPYETIGHFVSVKDMQFRQIFVSIGMPRFITPVVRIAVIGCKEKRQVELHRQMFERLFEKPVQMTTFDITTEHLEGAEGVVKHDATQPLPGGPYDLVYADVLVRFIVPTSQFSVLRNAYDALAPQGLAVVSFSKEDFDPPPGYAQPPGTHHVNMIPLQLELAKSNIPYVEVPVTVETIPPGKQDKIAIDDLFIILRKP